MNIVKIDNERCKGCGLCVNGCPKKVLGMSEKLNSHGCHTAVFKSGECIGCALCALICPDCAVTIYKENANG